MKKIGLVIFIIGIIMTVFSGFELFTRKKIIDIGQVEITTRKKQVFDWSPLIGIGVMAAGAGVYLFTKRTRTYIHLNK
jgi:hypothetical protein